MVGRTEGEADWGWGRNEELLFRNINFDIHIGYSSGDVKWETGSRERSCWIHKFGNY